MVRSHEGGGERGSSFVEVPISGCGCGCEMLELNCFQEKIQDGPP